MLDQGLTLMVYGIGSVFLFLTLLVLTTTVMSKLVKALAPAVVMAAQQATKSNAAIDDKTLAVIRAAITQHRSNR